MEEHYRPVSVFPVVYREYVDLNPVVAPVNSLGPTLAGMEAKLVECLSLLSERWHTFAPKSYPCFQVPS